MRIEDIVELKEGGDDNVLISKEDLNKLQEALDEAYNSFPYGCLISRYDPKRCAKLILDLDKL